MRTKDEIIQEYAMGLLAPGELVCQLKPYYKELCAFKIFKHVNAKLSNNK